MTIFFKTEFWRKVMINHYNDEISWDENLFSSSLWPAGISSSLWPAGIIKHFEDWTLDLMTEKPYKLFADQEIKQDCKWP